jgi:hypothetical protein
MLLGSIDFYKHIIPAMGKVNWIAMQDEDGEGGWRRQRPMHMSGIAVDACIDVPNEAEAMTVEFHDAPVAGDNVLQIFVLSRDGKLQYLTIDQAAERCIYLITAFNNEPLFKDVQLEHGTVLHAAFTYE